MAHSRPYGFALIAAVSLVSGALSFMVASLDRMTEAIAAFVQAVLTIAPARFDFVPAPVLARTLGLPQVRSFARRRIDRPDSRSRAPDSMAFVTA